MNENTGSTQAQDLGDVEWFESSRKGRAARYDFPAARIDPSGRMMLNRAALEMLGDPTHITFGFSRRLGLIALRPSTTAQVSAYKLLPVSKDSFSLNFGAFMKTYGLGHMRRNTYRLSVAQGMGLIAPDAPEGSS